MVTGAILYSKENWDYAEKEEIGLAHRPIIAASNLSISTLSTIATGNGHG
jgi:hypothetical protein